MPWLRRSLPVSLALLAAACAPKPAPPPAPAPAPPPPAGPQAEGDWRDVPLSPGDWSYAQDGADSVARFADGAFEARCDPTRRIVRLSRAGALPPGLTLTMSVTTSTSTIAFPAASATDGAVAMVPAAHSGLDQMAFSRGRFVVAVPGLAKLTIPAWPEFARVVEDCRRPA